MAPEQAKGEPIDHRVDIYALAAVIYRCVTGRAAFSARDTPSLLYTVVHHMPMRPGSIAPVSSQIDAVLAIGLAKSRDARFQTAGELAAAYAAAEQRGSSLADPLRQRARALPSWHEPESAPTQEIVLRR
jgi:serine/threonine-protein kinase